MYDTITHLRPPFNECVSNGDCWILTFSCTQMQADYYFFKFGAEAEVLTPTSLRNDFRKKYALANAQYSE